MGARQWSVCPASGDRFTAYAGKDRKDDEGCVPCPVCRKVVKLRQQPGDRWPSTIPHHHAEPNEENLARMRQKETT